MSAFRRNRCVQNRLLNAAANLRVLGDFCGKTCDSRVSGVWTSDFAQQHFPVIRRLLAEANATGLRMLRAVEALTGGLAS